MLDLSLSLMKPKPKITKLLTFDGTTAYAELPETITFVGDFEIEVYAQTSADDTTTDFILSQDYDTNYPSFGLLQKLQNTHGTAPNGTQAMVRKDATTLGYMACSKDITDGKLHKIVLSRSGDDFTLTIDDGTTNTVDTRTTTYASAPSQVVTLIGGRYTGASTTSNYFDGIIKSVKLTDTTTPANSREYRFSNGRDDYIIDKLNPSDTDKRATLYNVSSSDWDKYYFDYSLGDNVGWVSRTELITNGRFSDGDTGWALNTASVVSGECVFNNVSTGIFQGSSLAGTTYLLKFNIVSLSAGAGFRGYIGGTSGTIFSTTGKHTDVIVGTVNQTLGVKSQGTVTGIIDSVSIREVILL
jgi:hypothetical protein